MSEVHLGDDPQVRAMVALVEAQAVQIAALKSAVESLEARLALRGALDTVVLEQVRDLHQEGELSVVLEQLLTPPEMAPVSLARNSLQRVNLNELVGKALALLRGAGAVGVDIPSGFVVVTSPARLVAMLNALVDNALRHGSQPIEVRAEAMGVGDLLLQVCDRGPGLDGLDVQAYLTGPNPLHREGGTFGLYLVHRLAQSLGGELTLVDRPGGGAVATLRLPQRRDQDPSAE
ncbi:MAG TPA: sensor histidine kinase [Acidimicrobiales bacterium]|jgi:two-component system sensor histidine kinase MtrB|nr:sensor histidine kinase [Acidimicrobiales bacterium]